MLNEKILLGPTNFANQPMLLTQELKKRGLDANHLLYQWPNRRKSGIDFPTDITIELDINNCFKTQSELVLKLIDDGYTLFHFWNRSLVYPPLKYTNLFRGFDIPLLKASGKKIIYRFTGYDLRLKSLDMSLNPYSPFKYGFQSNYYNNDETEQKKYLDFLRENVDSFVVQDPEMQAFLPEATIIPRGLNLQTMKYIGVNSTKTPLIVHAPTAKEVKGTTYVLRAIEELRHRGLKFNFKLVHNVTYKEAMTWYKKADIVIDQLLIGWYGVLSIEAMALGKPVIAYIQESLYDKFKPSIPIVNATIDNLANRLEPLIKDIDLRKELGKKGRQFVEEVHDIRNATDQTIGLYKKLEKPKEINSPKVTLESFSKNSNEIMMSLQATHHTNNLMRATRSLALERLLRKVARYLEKFYLGRMIIKFGRKFVIRFLYGKTANHA